MITTLLSLAVMTATPSPAQQLAVIDDILAFQEPPTPCTCEIERLAGADEDESCDYSYTCTNDLSGETSASCDVEQAKADITVAACQPE
ncbi:MAG: hypothetical protein AAF830_08755 [Pseudomonadota bacterium]